MKKLDGKIKVGSRTYKIKTARSYDANRNHDWGGVANYRELLIWINSDRASEYQVNTLFHELVHVMFEEAAIPQLKENDVERLSNVLKQVIEDNPNYFGKGGKLRQGL